jgi:hypothetical protein
MSKGIPYKIASDSLNVILVGKSPKLHFELVFSGATKKCSKVSKEFNSLNLGSYKLNCF